MAMSLDLIVHEVKELLATAVDEQKLARIKLQTGDAVEQVAAAGSLLVQRRRELILRARLEELQRARRGWMHEFTEWLREQAMLVELEIDNWVTR
jgi:hypothetical protein